MCVCGGGRAEGDYLGKGPVGEGEEQKQQEIIDIYENTIIIHICKKKKNTFLTPYFQNDVKIPKLLISPI